MLKKIDLHIHSTYSDGTNSVDEIFQIALKNDLDTISITDHDSISSYQEALICAKKYGISYLPGIELSTDFEGKEIHILGYGIDPDYEPLLQHLNQFIQSRTLRNHKMIALLNSHGFQITYSELEKMFPNSILTRAHIARYLFQTQQLSSIQKAFRYIQDDGPCYVTREKFSASKAIQLIHDAKGIAIVAHPTLYHLDKKGYEHLFSSLKENDLDGLEGIYSTYSVSETNLMKQFSEKYQLVRSGGTDYHGDNKSYIHMGNGRGKLFIPSSILDELNQQMQFRKETSVSL